MKYLKKFENLDDDKFTSRLDGSKKSKSDYEKRGDFWKQKDMSDDDFGDELKEILPQVGKYFHNEHLIDSDLVFKFLKNTWNYDDELLRKVADHFQSFDYSHLFLNEYDSANDIEEAWENFTKRILDGEEQQNPFI